MHFVEPISGIKIPYNRIHRRKPYWWKDRNFNLKLEFTGDTHDKDGNISEEYTMYLDMIWLHGEVIRHQKGEVLEPII